MDEESNSSQSSYSGRNCTDCGRGKEKHQKLAGVVKGVHARLRRSYKQYGDYDKVWKDHCKDTNLLDEYADAMHSLATDIWSQRPDTRIQWCRDTLLEYFFKDGLAKALAKDERRKKYKELAAGSAATSASDTVSSSEEADGISRSVTGSDGTSGSEELPPRPPVSPACQSEGGAVAIPANHMTKGLPTSAHHMLTGANKHGISRSNPEKDGAATVISDEESLFSSQEQMDSGQSSLGAVSSESELIFGSPDDNLDERRKEIYAKYAEPQYTAITLPFEGRIRLLDVGSCYNPFLSFEEFQSIGVDISPAVESVYKCDFLNLELTEPLQLARDSTESFFNALPNPIERMPRDSFHVVVFSLLLEYFPAQFQRWLCCQKAHELLMLNGLLVIITPDSHSCHKNAPMMQSWKRAIESMGFTRWRYVKQEHLHCMAFRKTTQELQPQGKFTQEWRATPDMLYIPQDFQEPEEDHTRYLFGSAPHSDEDLRDAFNELPDFAD